MTEEGFFAGPEGPETVKDELLIVLGFIALLKVAEIAEFVETPTALLAGEVETTVAGRVTAPETLELLPPQPVEINAAAATSSAPNQT